MWVWATTDDERSVGSPRAAMPTGYSEVWLSDLLSAV